LICVNVRASLSNQKVLLSQVLRSRARDLGLQNVIITLGEPHDPRLPADSLDIAILVHMYHEIAQPYGLLHNLVPALKPGAQVGIVDSYGPTSEHGNPPNLLRCELAAVGYREISLDRLTGSNAYLAIFAAATGGPEEFFLIDPVLTWRPLFFFGRTVASLHPARNGRWDESDHIATRFENPAVAVSAGGGTAHMGDEGRAVRRGGAPTALLFAALP
jgi:hypothetical protein